jgi:hypothetical protein
MMIADKYKEYMHGLITRVIDEFGPREPCTESEKKAGRLIAEEMKPLCDRVDIEEFTCSPTAFLGIFPLLVLCYIVSAALYWVFPPAAFIVMLAGVSMLYFEVMRYREFVDRFYPKRQGENIIGVIKPRGEVRRRVIVSGHLDSAYEFTLWYFLRNAAVPHMIIGVLSVLFLLGICLARSISFFGGTSGAGIFTTLGIISVALYPLVGLFIFYHTYTAVPGAMDNLSAVSVAVGLGKYLRDSRDSGGFVPRNTEVVLIGMSSEEAGLRGTMRYVKKHFDELKAVPSYGIFLDGIADEKYLSVVKREVFTGAKHAPELVKLAKDVAAKHGWPMRTSMIPIGGSDAAEFSRRGFKGVCILCQDTTKLDPNYHTRTDIPENVRPEALAVCLQLVIDMVEELDKQ